jgi:hypothetical protein
MRLKKLVPMVGFCAVSVLSSSAIADQHEWWAVNCATDKCLLIDAGKVIVSECKLGMPAQQWLVTNDPREGLNGMPPALPPITPDIREKLTSGFIKSFEFPKKDEGQCLAMKHRQVITRSCENRPQEWIFPPLRGADDPPTSRPGNRVNQIKIGNQCLAVEGNELSVVDCAITNCPKGETGIAKQCWFWVNVGAACPTCE